MEFLDAIDPDLVAGLGWKAAALAMGWRLAQRWLRDRGLDKLAAQAVRWAANEGRRQLREGRKIAGEELEGLALNHLRRVGGKVLRGLDESQLRGLIVEAYEELRAVEAETRYREGMAFDMDAWRKQIDQVPTVTEQLDRIGATRTEEPAKE